MKELELHLQKIQEDNIQEFDPATLAVGAVVGLGVATVRLIAQFISLIAAAAAIKRQVKVDKDLTKRINTILNSGNTWIAHMYPEPSPNAFAIGGKHIFITTGLTKLLDKREVDAVMLHEVFHNKDLHLWKQFATTNLFFYLLMTVAMSAAVASGVFFLGYLAFYMMSKISNILYNRVMGRRHELKADEHAVKYGYGKELASGLMKMEKYVQKMRSRAKCGKLCQIERGISEALDEHPPLLKRVEIVLRKTKELEQASKSFAKLKKFVVKVFKENG